MRRLVLALAVMAVTLVAAGGIALAVNKIGTNGPDTLRGTNGDDNLIGKGGNDRLFFLNGRDTVLGGRARIWLLAIQGRGRSEATRTYREVPATI